MLRSNLFVFSAQNDSIYCICGGTHSIALSPNFDQNHRYDGEVQEDEPAEAKFSDDEEEAAFLREQKKSGTAANAQVSGWFFSFY